MHDARLEVKTVAAHVIICKLLVIHGMDIELIFLGMMLASPCR